jgi:hypothetical protein
MKTPQDLYNKVLIQLQQAVACKKVDEAANKSTSYQQGKIDVLTDIGHDLAIFYECKDLTNSNTQNV